MGKREVKESPVERGVTEEYGYSFTLTNMVPSGTYTNAFNNLYSQAANGDYDTAVTGWDSGSPSVSSTTFTTSAFVANELTPGSRYRLHWGFDIDGKQWDWNLYIDVKL